VVLPKYECVCSMDMDDAYLVLVSSSGTILSWDDDVCDVGSQVTNSVDGCETLTLRQGCFAQTSYGGTVFIVKADFTALPSFSPTYSPTNGLPFEPTVRPTKVPTKVLIQRNNNHGSVIYTGH
jgi:hypothetical protein